MQHLQINNLSFKYQDRYIFTNLNLSFQVCWSCLVGQNGCGKTTLLKLISNILKLESGNIIGNDLVYYCEQELKNKPEGFEEFIQTYNNKTFRLKELLGIEEEWFYRWESLSFGERKRIQIAIALFYEPDVLLLDEPTNHLDMNSKNKIIKCLQTFKGIGLLVSHDRVVLNTLCDSTVLIKNQKIYTYKTSYDEAIKQFNQEIEFLGKENENLEQKIKKLEKNIQSQKEKVNQSKARLSKKNIDKHDRSLKEKINLAKLTGKDKSDSKLVTNFTKKAQELISKKNEIDKNFDKGIVIKEDNINKSKFSFYIKEGFLKLSESKMLNYPNLSINHGDKIAIVGNNGVGKSSFLNHLIQSFNLKQNFLYIPQEIEQKDVENFFDELNSLNNEQKGKLFTYIQRLSSNPKNLLTAQVASPGELRKLFIAKALLDNINLIVLDEPTNHMDIDSIQAIESALKEYNCTLIIISHDKIFIENIAAKVWEIFETYENVYELKELIE